MKNGKVVRTRKRLGLTQSEFWQRVGVRQDTGSRYERGTRIPRPVQVLLDLAYGSAGTFGSALKRVRQKGNG